MTDESIRRAVAGIEHWMVQARRALHSMPEIGFGEFKTQSFIQRKLAELGIPFTAERTWTIGLIEGARPGGTVALRADIDALPLDEPEGPPFRSEHPGRMHACGHDAHTAILLGAARVLAANREQLAGNVKLLFQPAEETEGGAKPMVEAGALQNPRVDWAFGLHVMPQLPLGAIETRAGTLNASTDDLLIRVHGKAGHGAYPDTGADAIVCAAQLVGAAQTLISRSTSPLKAAVIHFGMIEGGVAQNIVCDCVTLRGTLRTADKALHDALTGKLKRMAEELCRAMGCEAEVHITPNYLALVNHAREARLVMEVAARMFGRENVLEKEAPSMGAEDFAYFIENTPGAFYHIGCTPPGQLPAPPLHSRNFFLDEGCLAVGATLEVALVNELIGIE